MSASTSTDPASSSATRGGADARRPSVVSRRGCFGSIVSGGCGCTAFLVGAALAIAMAAPQLLSGWGARFLKNAIEKQIDGEVEIYDLELSWREHQRAGKVTLHTTSGRDDGKSEQVAQFALRFPSLLDFLGGPSKQWWFVVTDVELTARVDADGTSDLGRSLGLDAGDGRSEIQGLLAALNRGFRPEGDDERRSIKTTFTVRSARFIDMASGVGSDREEATITDLELETTRSRLGFQVKLRDATILHSVSEEASASFALIFGEGPGRPEALLTSATVQADPIPLATLRLLGLLPRSAAAGPDTGARNGVGRRAGFASRDAYGSMASGLMRAAEHFMEGGASVDVRYNDPADLLVASSGPPAPPRLSVTLAGDVGRLELNATHIGSQLVGEPAPGERNALELGFRMPSGQLAQMLSRLAPEDAVAFQETSSDARWFLRSRRFQIPLDVHALGVSQIFAESAARPSAPPRPTDPVRVVAARQATVRQVTEALRSTDGVFSLSSDASSAARVALWPAGDVQDEAAASPYDRLDWTHRYTRVNLSGDLGVTASSRWRVAQVGEGKDQERAEFSLSIPGAALSRGEDLSPRLDVNLPQVPLALVQALAPIPSDLAALLPKRFDRLELQGVRLPQLLAGRTRLPGAARPAGVPIRVVAILDGTDRIEGSYSAGTMTVPRADVSVPLNQMYCDRVIRAYMPWFATVEPGDSGRAERSLGISMRDFVFTMGQDAHEQKGEVELRSGPLYVTLHPDIASKLGPSERERLSQDIEDVDARIAWTPGPTLLSLDGLFVRYERIELPLSDDYVPLLDGYFDRKIGRYSLNGTVESDFIDGQSGGTAFQMMAINGRDGAEVSVTFERGSLDQELLDVLKAASEKVK